MAALLALGSAVPGQAGVCTGLAFNTTTSPGTPGYRSVSVSNINAMTCSVTASNMATCVGGGNTDTVFAYAKTTALYVSNSCMWMCTNSMVPTNSPCTITVNGLNSGLPIELMDFDVEPQESGDDRPGSEGAAD